MSTLARRLRRMPTGSTVGEIEIPAGAREITVSVFSGQGSWTQTTSREIGSGATVTLDVRVLTGRTTGMEIKWKK